GALEPFAAGEHAGLARRLAEHAVRGEDLGRLLRRGVDVEGLVVVDDRQVLHGSLLMGVVRSAVRCDLTLRRPDDACSTIVARSRYVNAPYRLPRCRSPSSPTPRSTSRAR